MMLIQGEEQVVARYNVLVFWLGYLFGLLFLGGCIGYLTAQYCKIKLRVKFLLIRDHNQRVRFGLTAFLVIPIMILLGVIG